MNAPSRTTKPAQAADPGLRLVTLREGDIPAVLDLVDRAFGPGRFAKTAARLREGSQPRLELSFGAWAGETLAGAVTLWPIRIGAARAVFLGPIAVEPRWRGRGISRALTEAACTAAADTGERVVLLVGDPPLFGPAGFEQVPPGRLSLPGPVDPRRVLWRALADGALERVDGPVTVHRPG